MYVFLYIGCRYSFIALEDIGGDLLHHSPVLDNHQISTYEYFHMALSQLRISRPFPLSFNPTYMKDAQCAETKKKIESQIFNFRVIGVQKVTKKLNFIQKWPNLEERSGLI